MPHDADDRATTLLLETLMRLAMDEAERARGRTGDNPWVGCVIVASDGTIVGRGHTQAPGEAHAEVEAARDARARGASLAGATLVSTLEPCAFHGRTPACAHSIARWGIGRVVTALRDPHPRVDGAGARIVEEAGIALVEGVLEAEVRRQLGPWIAQFHPHEPRAWWRARGAPTGRDGHDALVERYGLTDDEARVLLERWR